MRPSAGARWAGALALALAATVLVRPCAPMAQAPRPKVAATIFPLYDIARQVAGGAVDVVLILPPGASPHTFEPTPDRVRAVSGARALFVIGHGLDGWAADMARAAGAGRVVRVDAGIALRRFGPAESPAEHPAEHGDVDPHYWLSVPNAKAIARTVEAELERIAPERGGALRRTLAVYLDQLDEGDREIRRELADLPTRGIVTFHDAFEYFAGAYGLEVVAVFEPAAGREPSPREVQEFYRRVRAAGLRVVFHEPQFSADVVRPIARDLGISLSVLDPLGGVPGRDGYIALMRFDARQVADAGRRPR